MKKIILRVYFVCIILIFQLLSFVGCEKTKKIPPKGMVLIPKGEFIMGTNKRDDEGKGAKYFTKTPFYMAEHPERKIYLDDFFIDMYEVTNFEYQLFDTDRQGTHQMNDHPVTLVNWIEADQFCRSIGKDLPTEEEWEKSARGTDGREYPWGNEFDELKANTGKYSLGTTPVGQYPSGKSPYGVYDMAGNVWEWTAGWYEAYPGNTYESEYFGKKLKVIRGGSRVKTGHYSLSSFFRSAHRLGVSPGNRTADTGFRCVK